MSRGHTALESLSEHLFSGCVLERTYNAYKYRAHRPRARNRTLLYRRGNDKSISRRTFPGRLAAARAAAAAAVRQLIDGSQYRLCRGHVAPRPVSGSPTPPLDILARYRNKLCPLIYRSYIPRKDSLMHGTGARLPPLFFSYLRGREQRPPDRY